jgi:hypothetical protein
MTSQHPINHEWLTQETFSELLEEYLLARNEKRRAKTLLSQDCINQCIEILESNENAENYDAKLKYWVRTTFYIGLVGNQCILYHKRMKKPVCPKEKLYEKLCEFHLEIGHGGMSKTYEAVSNINLKLFI